MRIIVLIILLALSNTGNAQSIAIDKMPKTIIQTFNKMYPKAAKQVWQFSIIRTYHVDFSNSGIKSQGEFDGSGKWLHTRSELNIDQLPQAVHRAVVSRSYEISKVSKDEDADAKDKISYCIDWHQGNASGFTRYSPDGKVINAAQ